MYLLRHLDSSRYYAVTNDSKNLLRHKIVCFERYEDAIRVGNSIATYKHKNNRHMPISNKVYLIPKEYVSRDAFHEDIFVDHHEMDGDFMRKVVEHNIAIMYINHVSESGIIHSQSIEQYSEVLNIITLNNLFNF
jgi:hypothetical protein